MDAPARLDKRREPLHPPAGHQGSPTTAGPSRCTLACEQKRLPAWGRHFWPMEGQRIPDTPHQPRFILSRFSWPSRCTTGLMGLTLVQQRRARDAGLPCLWGHSSLPTRSRVPRPSSFVEFVPLPNFLLALRKHDTAVPDHTLTLDARISSPGDRRLRTLRAEATCS